MPEKRDPIVWEAKVMGIYKPRRDQLLAAADVGDNKLVSKDKPRFCALLLLATLNKRNGNGHRLPLEHTRNAIAALGDKPFIMADLNHTTGGRGVSTNIWIDEEGEYPLLMLEALFWSRAFTKEEIDNLNKEYDKDNLGASWEIDWPYELIAAEDEPDTFDVTNFGLSGFCLTVGVEPADTATKGNVTITATKGGGEVDEKEFWEILARILLKGEDINAALLAEDVDQDFIERFFYELDNDGLEAAKLTYQQRKDLDDSDFAYVKTETGKSGKKIKVRRFPIHDEDHRVNCVQRLPQAKGLSAEEKGKIFRKCLARGKSAGDKWAEKYKGYDTSVYPPKKKTATANEVAAYPGELPVGFLSEIKCPVCGARFGDLRKADFEQLQFHMQCTNRDEQHKFIVTINVKAEGKSAEYQLTATQDIGDIDEFASVILKQINEEVNSMAEPLTEDRIKELIEDAFTARESTAEAKAKEEKDVQKRIDDAVAEARKDEREKAIKEYKDKQKLGASRVDEVSEIIPYESAEAKAEAIELLAEMSQEEYERHKADKEKDKELAELRAKVEDGEPDDEKKPADDLTATTFSRF